MGRLIGSISSIMALVLALGAVGASGHIGGVRHDLLVLDKTEGGLAAVSDQSIGEGVVEGALAARSIGGEASCEVCISEDGKHGFAGGASTYCTEENREDNPSCRVCGGEEPAGHAGCHGTSTPQTGLCSTHGEPSCGEGGASFANLLEQAFTAVEQEDPSFLSVIAQSDALYVNWDRQAIQAFNCVGTVVAHIPLSSRYARRLAFGSSLISAGNGI